MEPSFALNLMTSIVDEKEALIWVDMFMCIWQY